MNEIAKVLERLREPDTQRIAELEAENKRLRLAVMRSGKEAHYVCGHKGYFGDCSASSCYQARTDLGLQ